MKEITVDRISGIGSICLGFLLAVTTENGFQLGNGVFRFFGIPSYSNGQTGLFYPGILALILIVFGLAITLRRLGLKKIVLIILICNFLLPPLVGWGRETYLRGVGGLDAIEYNRKMSNFDISVQNPSDMMQIRGAVTLTNYSKEQVSFGLKLRPKDYQIDRDQGWFRQDIVLYGQNADGSAGIDSEEGALFLLGPGETRRLEVYSAIPNYNRFSSMTGMLNGPDLVLSDGQEEKYFKT